MKWFYQSENRRIGELPISRFFCPYPFFISSGVAALTKLFPQKNSQKAQHDAYQRSGRIDAHIKKTARPAGDKNLVQLIRHRIKGGQSPSQKGPASPPGAVQRMKQQNRPQRTANAQDWAQRKACLLDWNRIMNPAAPLSKSAPCHPACGKQSRKHSVPSQRNCSLHTAGKLGRFGSNAFPPACTAE